MDNDINKNIGQVRAEKMKRASKILRIIITAGLCLLLTLLTFYCFVFPIEPDHIQIFKPISQTADGPIAMCYCCIVISIGLIVLWYKRWLSYLVAVLLIIIFIWRIGVINKMVEDDLQKQESLGVFLITCKR